MSRTTIRTAFAAVVAPLALAACSGSISVGDVTTIASKSVSVGGMTIKKADIESSAVEAFGTKVPEGAKISCPGDLEGKKGATIKCVWQLADGSTLGTTATVTSFTASTGKFKLDFENDQAVTPAK